MKKIVCGMLIALLFLGAARAIPAEAGTAGTYKVSVDTLTVRDEPSGSADEVGYLKQGETVAVSDEQYGWMKVKAGSLSGWVAGYYLVKTSSKGASASTASTAGSSGKGKDDVHIASVSDQGVVTGDSVRIRKGPGTSYDMIGSLSKGDKVNLLDSKSGWFKVLTESRVEGWMSGQYIGGASAGASSENKPPSAHGGLRGKVIVVDPGHGGDDPGMIGTYLGTEEKDLTLSTGKLLADRLRSLGAKVIMTRTSDTKPSLSDRVEISESARADAFVSIHYNSSTKNTSGTLAFYYSENKDEPLARAIDGHLGKNAVGLKNNGISFGDFHVLRENNQPAALVELGFLTNKQDEKLVRTSSFQRDAANAIAAGLQDYFQ
ncbi:N-acetylmuramoyl-L-alanine amidase [Paenibacillus humicola]|uniref:N-acetylmuramoyl-L-alanine amidase n=1 Tax=Paenibacillus humicola TaxID=3110540 RepID=UPI00237C304F|nr:N-acetylmuramoyl-L-alanine amidase [Paenibacillus humicola]